MRETLPLLISVPHGGHEIPPELRERVALTESHIFEDGDALTREIYAFQNEVIAFIDTPIARAFVDLNRSPFDRPPENPDGIVKTVTTMRRSVYKAGQFPDEALIERVLRAYYFPYHARIDELHTHSKIQLALDCHSMLAQSPPISDHPGKLRPLICLSNRGDEKGYPTEQRGPVTCPPKWIQLLAECFCSVFEIEKSEVEINNPFFGGYIIQSHFRGDLSWIQLEINRKLYLSPPNFNADLLAVVPERIAELRNKILTTMKLFIKLLEKFNYADIQEKKLDYNSSEIV